MPHADPSPKKRKKGKPKTPARIDIKVSWCKGCGLCAAECPCGAIKMVPEDI